MFEYVGEYVALARKPLWMAAQKALVVAVAVADVTAAVRNSRTVKKFIRRAAAPGAIKAAVVETAMIAKFRRQIFCPVPIEQRPYAVARWIDLLARVTAGQPKKKRKHCEADRFCPAHDLSVGPTNRHEACNRPTR